MKNYENITVNNSHSLKQQTVYFFLKSHNFSERYISRLRTDNESILLNGRPVTLKDKIKDGDIISIQNNPRKASNIFLCDGKLDIIFEDDDFLVVNKPHNLACAPSRSHFYNNLGGIVCNYMQQKNANFVLRIVNRLDKDTAGIVLIAKNLVAYSNIQNITKEYHALCDGNLIETNFTVNSPIKTITQNGINQMKRIISNDGKPAVTHIHLIQNFDNFALISLKLETGRTHQIRVHLASIGHNLLGDRLYTNGKNIQNFSHTMLILKKMEFTHFRTQERLTFEIPYPQIWQDILNKK